MKEHMTSGLGIGGMELVLCGELIASAHCLPSLGIIFLGTSVTTQDINTPEVGVKSPHLGAEASRVPLSGIDILFSLIMNLLNKCLEFTPK